MFPKEKLRLGLEAALALAALIGLIILGRASSGDHAPLPYLYEDTKQLVFLVEDAARLIEKQGTAAFQAFAARGSRWHDKWHQLFIYELNGVCLFHPALPELIGRHLVGLKDLNGKPVGRWINEIGLRPEPQASGWVFYLWEARHDLAPTWKLSYICKAVGPDGKVYLVGSGRHNFKVEPIFVKNCVDRAVNLLQKQGKELAFAQFLDPASSFSFGDTYTYVLDDQGRCLVDPAFPSLVRRDLQHFQDAMGHYPVHEALQQLKKSDTAWVQYMLPRPGAAEPSRKLAYVRKVTINGDELVVWADFFLATPIWMKM